MEQKKVFVGLSGGVDSALAAAILVRAGYQVTGVFIKIWQPDFVLCTWKEDRLAAMKVAVSLGIPFLTLDLSDVYKDEIISRMVKDYKKGITPNPDVLCNRYIKFGAFRKWAHEKGADLIATGHHAQVEKKGEFYRLLRGVDVAKDQAYFLSQLTQDDLAHSLFPIGHLSKQEVRTKAEQLGLPSASRPDSQGLCFVGDVDMHTFLQEILDTKIGEVKDESGVVIGEHDGAALYTIGQRHGFRTSSKEYSGVVLYVTSIDTKTNTIVVQNNIDKVKKKKVSIADLNWIRGLIPKNGKYTSEIRYHQTPKECSLTVLDEKAEVTYEESQLAVPGQFLVLYKENECIGSGVILS